MGVNLRPVVTPRLVEGWNGSFHFRGPLLTIQCGACPGTFQQRVPVVDYPTVLCPYCKTFNRLPFVREG